MRTRLLVCLLAALLGASLRSVSAAPSTIHPGSAPPAGQPSAASPVGAPVAVLVHGFQGVFGSDYRCTDGVLADSQPAPRTGRSPAQTGEFGRLARTLREAGYRLYFARWTTSPERTITIEAAADCLRDQLRTVRARAGVAELTLVGQSMGGLVSRAYVEGPSYEGDVTRLITFGTPHLGIPPVMWIKVLNVLMPFGKPCEIHEGACQLTSGEIALFNLAHPPREGVSYHRVGGDGAWWFTAWIFGLQPNDGVVPLFSSADQYRGGWWTADSHSTLSIPFTGPGYDSGAESAACLGRFLAFGARARACRRLFQSELRSLGETSHLPDAIAVQPSVALDSFPVFPSPADRATATRRPSLSFAPGVEGRLSGEQTVSLPVDIDGTDARIVLIWQGEQVRFDLQSPGGTLVTAANVAIAIPGGEYRHASLDGSRQVAMYALPVPLAGRWRVILTDTSGGSAEYRLETAFDSPVSLAIDAPPVVSGGQRITVRAVVTEHGVPQLGAAGWVTLSSRGGDAAEALRATAKGIYSAELVVPRGRTPVQLSVTVSGVARSGDHYARQVESILAVDAATGKDRRGGGPTGGTRLLLPHAGR